LGSTFTLKVFPDLAEKSLANLSELPNITGFSLPKSSFRMTKKPGECHSERSEESRALIGRIINETQ